MIYRRANRVKIKQSKRFAAEIDDDARTASADLQWPRWNRVNHQFMVTERSQRDFSRRLSRHTFYRNRCCRLTVTLLLVKGLFM